MVEHRIHCKINDNRGMIKAVGIGAVTYTVEEIWRRINNKTHSFFTLENNNYAKVRHGTSRNGNHYITTHPDGITENNLGELEIC